jgi:hypothetical protein
LKQREPRLNVMIKARVRAGASWSDALILNMSSKGMMVRSDQPLGRGSFLEIRRGPYVIVARVVWADGGRFGIQTQDPVPAANALADPPAAIPAEASISTSDRRSAARSVQVRHATSRHKGKALEFAAIALVCGLFALLLGGAVADVMAKPLGVAEAALASK